MDDRHQTPVETVEVTCPHCHKPFVPSLLQRPTARQRGYKCPHCRLFVPLDRAADTPDDAPPETDRS